MHHPTAFVTPVMEHCLEREIWANRSRGPFITYVRTTHPPMSIKIYIYFLDNGVPSRLEAPGLQPILAHM